VVSRSQFRNIPMSKKVVTNLKILLFLIICLIQKSTNNFVELFENFQIHRKLPDYTKYTEDGVDDEKHRAEHCCCLINPLVQLGCDESILHSARTCITGLNVPKSALKNFCDIAKIRIKIFYYQTSSTG
jgi:hypothetical protein